MDKPTISIIVAAGANNMVIGKDNDLLWHIPKDLKRFKEVTNGHPVIMGRKTWESIPERFRPLPNRDNFVITRNENYEASGATVTSSLEKAIQLASGKKSSEIFIIGGASIYKEAVGIADKLYITLVHKEYEGDTFFPDYSNFKTEVFREEHLNEDIPFTFLVLKV